MKKIPVLAIVCGLFLVITTACKKNDDSNPSSGNGSVSSSTPGSGWRVSLFIEPGDDKTNDYSGYAFEFKSNGDMTAVRNSQSTSGTWRQYSDDGVTKFAITLNTSDKDLSELNDDWVIVSKSDALISLKDDNAASNEQLQFGK